MAPYSGTESLDYWDRQTPDSEIAEMLVGTEVAPDIEKLNSTVEELIERTQDPRLKDILNGIKQEANEAEGTLRDDKLNSWLYGKNNYGGRETHFIAIPYSVQGEERKEEIEYLFLRCQNRENGKGDTIVYHLPIKANNRFARYDLLRYAVLATTNNEYYPDIDFAKRALMAKDQRATAERFVNIKSLYAPNLRKNEVVTPSPRRPY